MDGQAERASTQTAPVPPSARPAWVARGMAEAVRAVTIEAMADWPVAPLTRLTMTEPLALLWARFLRFDAADAGWPDRDRLVLSSGPVCPLLYALLHLTGHEGVGVDMLRTLARRQSSAQPGLPPGKLPGHQGIEAVAGPPGQGIATGVGLALAERLLAARFGRSLVDHCTWVIASGQELLAGLSHEAASLAGHLRLDRLCVLAEDLAGGEDPARRMVALGWAVQPVDTRDPEALAAAFAAAQRARKPTLILCRGAAPEGADTASGAPGPGGALSDAALDDWLAAGARSAGARRAWLKRLARHPLRGEFERVIAGRLPEGFREGCAALKARLVEAPSPGPVQAVLPEALSEPLAATMPELVGGSAATESAALPAASGLIGRNLAFGPRAHGMAALLVGLALHGGLVPQGACRLELSPALRPALRLAGKLRLRVVLVLTEDADSAEAPAEHLAALRALPDLYLFRPADAAEAAECWELALRRNDGPGLIVLPGQAPARLRSDLAGNRCARGGYVLAEAPGPRAVSLIATGAEVAVALAARAMLAADGIAAAVISLPCWELFAGQDEDYRAAVLGAAPRIGIEAASGFGWDRWLGPQGCFIGPAAPPEPGTAGSITAASIVAAARQQLAAGAADGLADDQVAEKETIPWP